MIHPFDQYLMGLEAFHESKKESAQHITQAIGGTGCSPLVESSLEKIFDIGTPLHDGVLQILDSEARKRRWAKVKNSGQKA